MRVQPDRTVQSLAYGQNLGRRQDPAEKTTNDHLPEPRVFSGDWSESNDSMFVYAKTHKARGVYEPSQVERSHLQTSRALRAVSVYGHESSTPVAAAGPRPGQLFDEFA